MTSSNDRLDQIALLRPHSIIAGNERMTRIEQSMERDASTPTPRSGSPGEQCADDAD